LGFSSRLPEIPALQYIWGLGGVGGLLAVVDKTNLKTYLPTSDARGTIHSLIDAATGAVVAEFSYDPYGRQLCSTKSGSGIHMPFKFQSKYYDQEFGLYNFGLRFYDPSTCMWLNRDPIAEDGGLNLYAFANGDPINNWDYLGCDAYDDITGGVNMGLRDAWGKPLAGFEGIKYIRSPWSMYSNEGSPIGMALLPDGTQINFNDKDTASSVIGRIRAQLGAKKFFEHDEPVISYFPFAGMPHRIEHLYWNVKSEDYLSASGNSAILFAESYGAYKGLAMVAKPLFWPKHSMMRQLAEPKGFINLASGENGIPPISWKSVSENLKLSKWGSIVEEELSKGNITVVLSPEEHSWIAGVTEGNLSKVYVPGHKDVFSLSKVVMHEGGHGLGVGGSQKAEVILRLMEIEHGGRTINREIIRQVIREVKTAKRPNGTLIYNNMPWRLNEKSEIFNVSY